MRPFENLTGLDREGALQAAHKAMTSRPTDRFFSDKSNSGHWMLTDPSQRSVNYHDHSWDMVEPVLLAYSQGGDPGLLAAACDLALAWCRLFANPQEREAPIGEKHMAWYDMAVGLRAYRLAYILDAAIHANALGEEDLETLRSSLLMHADYLADDANIKFHNNHGFFQAAGQLAMGCRFAQESDPMRRAKEQGEERFKRMLDAQFTPEGVHLEHSPDYHRMVHRTARAVVDAGLVEDRATIDFVARIEQALSWFVTPDGRIANLGDSERTPMRSTRDRAVSRWKTPEMQFVVTDGAAGRRHEQRARVFEEGGYNVARLPATNARRTRADAYLLQQGAFHSRTHKHADTLSFIWHDRGRPILVDAGRYGYGSKTAEGSAPREQGFWYSDPNRIYCETTKAHNCLEFDGEDYPRRGVTPPGSLVGRHAECPASGVVAFEAEARHFRGMRHARLLFLKGGHWLVCLDWFKDGLDRAHDATQWFHFDPAMRMQPAGDLDFLDMSEKGHKLRVLPLLPGVADAVHARGQREPTMQGWWSPAARRIEDNDAIGYRVRGATSAVIATLFTFASQDVSAQPSQVSASGRTGTLSWRDGVGTHRLRFERPADGDFTIDYARD